MNQQPVTRLVLVIENGNAPGMQVAAALRRSIGSLPVGVLTASDLPEASRIFKAQPVAAVVIEVGRETGEALSALRLLGKEDPMIPIFIYNGFQLPRIYDKSREYSQVHYFDDHRNLDRFITRIRDEVGRKKRGIIHGIPLGGFLQLMNQERFSGEIVVTSHKKRGTLFLSGGRLISAMMNGSKRNTALAEMSGWDRVTVEIREGQSPAASGGESLPGEVSGHKTWPRASQDCDPGGGHIDLLRFTLPGKKISIHVRRLQEALQVVWGMLEDLVLHTDIFLSSDGRSLASWNSRPLACSAFAAITRSTQTSLRQIGFPPLRDYYIVDLDKEHMILVFLRDELQWGMLLKGAKAHMGLLLNIIMPKTLAELAAAQQVTGMD